jgi:hypothetical protein
MVVLDGRLSMLVWGGLHRRAPTTKLEIYDVATGTWRPGTAEGCEPSPRFGHSAVYVPASDSDGNIVGDHDKIIFTGGSDGNDLIRNGIEYYDVSIYF